MGSIKVNKKGRMALGTCDQDNRNRAYCVAWRRAKPEDRHVYEGAFYRENEGCLSKYFARYTKCWATANAYLHIPKVLENFDLAQGRMSVIGYWKQRLDWKLPPLYVRESNVMPPPIRSSKKEREAIREFYTNLTIIRPDVVPIEVNECAWDAYMSTEREDEE